VKAIRILLHGFVLAVTNIVSVVVGFGVYHLVGTAGQIAVQVPVAAALTLAAFVVWSLFVRRLARDRLSLRVRDEFAATYLLAIVWSPLIFVPLHYIARGYLTSFGNIVGMWLFQLPANLLALFAAMKVMGMEGGAMARESD